MGKTDDERSSRLMLLNEERARAAIAWQFVERHRSPAPFRERAGPRSYYSPSEWMELAGLPFARHDAIAPALFRSELIDPDGKVAVEVVAYCVTLIRQRKPK